MRNSKKSLKTQDEILSILANPQRLFDIAVAVHMERNNVMYHVKKLIEDGKVKVVERKGARAQDKFIYMLNDGQQAPDYTPPPAPKLSMEELMLIESKKDNYRPRGAMAKVQDVYKKLTASARLVHKDREGALRRQRIGVGISQVYEG